MTAPLRRDALLSCLLLVLTALFWAGNIVLGRGLIDQLAPLGLNFWRWLVAFLVLAPFAGRAALEHWPAVRRDWKLLALLGLLGIAGFNSFAYTAFQTTTAINAALINATMPIMIVALAVAGFRDPFGWREGLGLALSLIGTVVILCRGDMAVLRALAIAAGDLWMMVGVALYALYSVLLRFRPRELDGAALLLVVIGFGILWMVPVYAAETLLVKPMPLTATSVGMVAYVAVFPSVLAYAFWNRGMLTLGPARASLFTHLVPVFTALLAVAFLGEALRPYHAAGMALVFTGLVLATRSGTTPVQAAPGPAAPAAPERERGGPERQRGE